MIAAGGGVAAQLTYQHPTRVQRLVLVSSGGVSREVSPFLRLASTPFADVFLPLLKLPPIRLGAMGGIELLRRSGTDLGRDAEELSRVLDALPDVAARGAFSRTLRSVVDWRGQVVTMLDRSYLAEAMPVLLVWGAHDAVIPVHHAQVAHERMPGSRLHVFADAGHFPHHQDPDRFLELLDEFIATSDPVRFDSKRWRRLLRRGHRRWLVLRELQSSGPGAGTRISRYACQGILRHAQELRHEKRSGDATEMVASSFLRSRKILGAAACAGLVLLSVHPATAAADGSAVERAMRLQRITDDCPETGSAVISTGRRPWLQPLPLA